VGAGLGAGDGAGDGAGAGAGGFDPLFGAGAASSSFAPPQAASATQAASIASLLFVINRLCITAPVSNCSRMRVDRGHAGNAPCGDHGETGSNS
jgi:hypothetical protein